MTQNGSKYTLLTPSRLPSHSNTSLFGLPTPKIGGRGGADHVTSSPATSLGDAFYMASIQYEQAPVGDKTKAQAGKGRV